MKLLKRLMSGQAQPVVAPTAPLESERAEPTFVEPMPAQDRAVIGRFADGEVGLRLEAEEAYRRSLSSIGEYGNDHMSFMTEVLSDSPDADRRASCRERILEGGADG